MHDGPMEDNVQRPRWGDRLRSPEFWMIAGPVLLFVVVFVVVLVD